MNVSWWCTENQSINISISHKQQNLDQITSYIVQHIAGKPLSLRIQKFYPYASQQIKVCWNRSSTASLEGEMLHNVQSNKIEPRKATALAHLTKFIEIVPRHVLNAAEMEEKRFPYTFLVSREFSAGIGMVVAVAVFPLTDSCKKS